jgi:hypothetical protein
MRRVVDGALRWTADYEVAQAGCSADSRTGLALHHVPQPVCARTEPPAELARAIMYLRAASTSASRRLGSPSRLDGRSEVDATVDL